MKISVEEIKAACGVTKCHLSAATVFYGISTDTRTVKAGDLYFALIGDRFDGHDFVGEALSKGALACIVSKPVPAKLEPKCLFVPDTLKALGDVASFWRRQFNIPAIVITGSAGKTTTKELIAAILEQVGLVNKTMGNLNNLIGLPLTLFSLTPSHQYAVLEIGMNAFGEIDRLAQIAQPSIALITNVGRAHLMGLGSIEGVAKAKAELFERLDAEAVALVNIDDPYIAGMNTRATKISYGFDSRALVRASQLVIGEDSMKLQVTTPQWQHEFNLPFVGEYLARNFLAAVAVAFLLKVPVEKIQDSLKNLSFIKHRGQKIELPAGISLIDDCYNANPEAMKAAFEAFKHRFPGRRKILILGDIFELGSAAADIHQEVGAMAAKNDFDCLFALGDFAPYYIQGFHKETGEAFTDINAMIQKLHFYLKKGDAVLVKGSRGARMERVVEALQQREA